MALTTLHSRSIPLEGDPSSVKVSRDSRYALINHAPDVRRQLFRLRKTLMLLSV